MSWLRVRALYPILERYGGVVGLWRSIGEGPVGSFYQFRWGRDCVEGVQLVYHSPLRCASAVGTQLPNRPQSCHLLQYVSLCRHRLCAL